MEGKECDKREDIAFLQIPKILFVQPQFRELSVGAKLLYGILIDRTSLSTVNEWKDSKKRIYVYCTVNNASEILGCSNKTAMKFFQELEVNKLIERKCQGLGKPSKILVKKIVQEVNDSGSSGNNNPG